MASLITLQNTIDGTNPVVKYRPIAFPSASIYEPACTLGNLVLLTILGPPFKWRWNRLPAATNFTCVVGQTDYPVAGLGSFGWIETAAAQDILDTPAKWQQMNRLEGLAVATEQGLPSTIAPQYDNGSGTITFRLMPAPSQLFPITIDIQKKPIVFNAAGGGNPLSQTWAPIPDEYSHLCTWGMLAMEMLLSDDTRFTAMNQKFVTALLSTHQGLSQNEINIFLAQWQLLVGSPIALMDRLQQGMQARGV